MARPAFYPKADHDGAHWYGDTFTGSLFSEVEKLCWHTTETQTLPGYSGGATAPTLTYSPVSRNWWQHFRIDRSARALKNLSGGVETNRDDVVQVEIICYSDRSVAQGGPGRLWVGDLPDHAYTDLADFARWLHNEWGLPLKAAPHPKVYVRFGEARFRMGGGEFDTFRGLLGHLNVPENDHWDPSVLDTTRIVTLASEGDEDMPLSNEDVQKVADAVWAKVINADAALAWQKRADGQLKVSASQATKGHQSADDANAKLKILDDKVDQLLAAIEQPPLA